MENTETLIAQAVNGDKAAQSQLYAISNKQVYYTCLSIVKNESDAEDIMQEVYLTAFQKLGTLSDPKSFQPWINRIAVTRCMNFVKKRRNISLDEEIEKNNREFTDEELVLPEDYVSDKVKAQVLQGIINEKLSDVQRETILMYYFHEMKVEEIAAEMDCPTGTVKYRLSAARQIIKQEVLSYEKQSGDRLHTFIPFPLGAFMLSQASGLTPPALAVLGSGASSAAGSAISHTGGKAAKAAVKKGIGAKIAAGVTAAAVAAGTATYVYAKNRPEEEETESQTESAEEEFAVWDVYGMLDQEYSETLETTAHDSVLKDGILYFYAGDKVFTYDEESGNFGTIELENLQKYCDVQFFGDYIYVMNYNNVTGYFTVDKYDFSGRNLAEREVKRNGVSIGYDDQSMRILSDGSLYIVDHVDLDDFHYINSDFTEDSLLEFPEDADYLDFYGDNTGDNIFVINDYLYIGATNSDDETNITYKSLLYDRKNDEWTNYPENFCAQVCGKYVLEYSFGGYDLAFPAFSYPDWTYDYGTTSCGGDCDDIRDYNGGYSCYKVEDSLMSKTIYVDTNETEFTQIGEESYDYTPLAYQYYLQTTEHFGSYTYYLCDGENEPIEVPND